MALLVMLWVFTLPMPTLQPWAASQADLYRVLLRNSLPSATLLCSNVAYSLERVEVIFHRN